MQWEHYIKVEDKYPAELHELQGVFQASHILLHF